MWFSFATWDYPDISSMLAFVRVWRTRSRTGTKEYIAGQEASRYSSNDAKQKNGKGQLLDQSISSATLSGDMSVRVVEDGKVHL